MVLTLKYETDSDDDYCMDDDSCADDTEEENVGMEQGSEEVDSSPHGNKL